MNWYKISQCDFSKVYTLVSDEDQYAAFVSPAPQSGLDPRNEHDYPFRITFMSYIVIIQHEYIPNCSDKIIYKSLYDFKYGDWKETTREEYNDILKNINPEATKGVRL